MIFLFSSGTLTAAFTVFEGLGPPLEPNGYGRQRNTSYGCTGQQS